MARCPSRVLTIYGREVDPAIGEYDANKGVHRGVRPLPPLLLMGDRMTRRSQLTLLTAAVLSALWQIAIAALSSDRNCFVEDCTLPMLSILVPMTAFSVFVATALPVTARPGRDAIWGGLCTGGIGGVVAAVATLAANPSTDTDRVPIFVFALVLLGGGGAGISALLVMPRERLVGRARRLPIDAAQLRSMSDQNTSA